MTSHPNPRFRGLFPVVPTIFDEQCSLDLEGQKRCVDFMIEAGSDGLCILANFSEQFVLADDERAVLTEIILDHVGGRVPVIVTTSHFSTQVCIARSRHAQERGAAMVMVMPPYHGATIRAGASRIREFFEMLSNSMSVPIMIQDAPVSGTVLTASELAAMAREIEHVAYFKIETPQAATKLRDLIAEGGAAIEGPWDGEEAITLLADLDAGATGSMTGGGYPDLLAPILNSYRSGDREGAKAKYNRCLPLINYENRQCGLLAAKILMREGGVIRSDAVRHPIAPLRSPIRAGLIEVARDLDALALRWGR